MGQSKYSAEGSFDKEEKVTKVAHYVKFHKKLLKVGSLLYFLLPALFLIIVLTQ